MNTEILCTASFAFSWFIYDTHLPFRCRCRITLRDRNRFPARLNTSRETSNCQPELSPHSVDHIHNGRLRCLFLSVLLVPFRNPRRAGLALRRHHPARCHRRIVRRRPCPDNDCQYVMSATETHSCAAGPVTACETATIAGSDGKDGGCLWWCRVGYGGVLCEYHASP